MTEETKKCAEAQKLYCNRNGYPRFAPYDGRCWGCGKNIYEGNRGYSLEKASNDLITGCPYCATSYCD